jgi:hypothetical protein
LSAEGVGLLFEHPTKLVDNASAKCSEARGEVNVRLD